MDLKFGFTISELIEQGRVHQSDVDSLKNWLSTETVPKLTNEQVALFLLSCNNQADQTKTVIKSYYKIRQMAPELFTERRVNSDQLQKQLNVGGYCVLPCRTSDNCAIIVVRLQDSNYHNFNFESHVKIICMLLDSVSYDNPPDGLISILDMQGTGIMHLSCIKLRLVRIFTRYVQECLPLKLKAVHLINGGSVLSNLFSMFKPFLKREVKEMIHLHQFETDLGKWIKKELLPEEYGGSLGLVSIYQSHTADKLDSMQSYFDAEEKQRCEFL